MRNPRCPYDEDTARTERVQMSYDTIDGLPQLLKAALRPFCATPRTHRDNSVGQLDQRGDLTEIKDANTQARAVDELGLMRDPLKEHPAADYEGCCIG